MGDHDKSESVIMMVRNTHQEASLPNLCRALIAAYDRIGYKEAKSLKEEPGSPDALAVVEAFEALRELAYDIAGEE